MITTEIPTVDFGPLKELLDMVDGKEIRDLIKERGDIQAQESELIRRTKDNDVTAAAQLTMNRIKLHEVFPAEIQRLEAEKLQNVQALWALTGDLFQECRDIATTVLKSVEQQLDAILIPVIAPLLYESARKELSVGSTYANRTDLGYRAGSFLWSLQILEKDYPEKRLPLRHMADMATELAHALDTAKKRAERLIDLWLSFTSPKGPVNPRFTSPLFS